MSPFYGIYGYNKDMTTREIARSTDPKAAIIICRNLDEGAFVTKNGGAVAIYTNSNDPKWYGRVSRAA